MAVAAALEGAKPVAGSGIEASKPGTLKRPDGTVQVTYNGLTLYGYTGDSKSGQLTGQVFAGKWFVLGRSGALVKTKPSSSTGSGGSTGSGTTSSGATTTALRSRERPLGGRARGRRGGCSVGEALLGRLDRVRAALGEQPAERAEEAAARVPVVERDSGRLR